MFRSAISTSRILSTFQSPATKHNLARSFSCSTHYNMPEALKKSELARGQDPSVAKQWDDKTGFDQKFQDFYDIADKQKICMMGTARKGVGVSQLDSSQLRRIRSH